MVSMSSAEMLTLYGLTLMIMGALAYHNAPQSAKAMSSIYMGNGGAVVSFLLAVGARDVTLKKGQKGYIPMMISVHLAFIFPILYGAAVAWRLALAWNVPTKAYLRPYLITILGMSLLTTVVVYAAKPRRSGNDEVESPNQTMDSATTTGTAPTKTTAQQRRTSAAK